MTAKQAKNEPKESAETWQKKAEDCLAGWQRTQADFDNYRKRIENSRHELAMLATADFALKITPVLDDFRRAFLAVPEDTRTSSWIVGMRQVEKRLRTILTEQGLTPIDETGEFDPRLHEAIATTPDPKIPAGTIIDIVELGWRLGENTIKPARVRVSSGQE